MLKRNNVLLVGALVVFVSGNFLYCANKDTSQQQIQFTESQRITGPIDWAVFNGLGTQVAIALHGSQTITVYGLGDDGKALDEKYNLQRPSVGAQIVFHPQEDKQQLIMMGYNKVADCFNKEIYDENVYILNVNENITLQGGLIRDVVYSSDGSRIVAIENLKGEGRGDRITIYEPDDGQLMYDLDFTNINSVISLRAIYHIGEDRYMITAGHNMQNMVFTAEDKGDDIKIGAIRFFSGDKTIIGNKGNILVDSTYHLASLYTDLEKEIILPSNIEVKQINDNDERFLYLYCSKLPDEGSVWQVDMQNDMKANQVGIIPRYNFLVSANGYALGVQSKDSDEFIIYHAQKGEQP